MVWLAKREEAIAGREARHLESARAECAVIAARASKLEAREMDLAAGGQPGSVELVSQFATAQSTLANLERLGKIVVPREPVSGTGQTEATMTGGRGRPCVGPSEPPGFGATRGAARVWAPFRRAPGVRCNPGRGPCLGSLSAVSRLPHAPQALLVARGTQGRTPSPLFKIVEVVAAKFVLVGLIVQRDARRSQGKLRGSEVEPNDVFEDVPACRSQRDSGACTLKVEGAVEMHNPVPATNVGVWVLSISGEGGAVGQNRFVHWGPFRDEVGQDLTFDRVPWFEVQIELS
uniref:Uncharacterized protein n=1 Tax=Oryza sativa subsp. japonica TaxID=39947 RepID=Q94GN6_ORYSJ|nr:hypothetical protein [Oryza sativa Japonica Group]